MELPPRGISQPSNDQGRSDLLLLFGAGAHGFLGGGMFTLTSAVPETSFWICCFRLTVGVTCIIIVSHSYVP